MPEHTAFTKRLKIQLNHIYQTFLKLSPEGKARGLALLDELAGCEKDELLKEALLEFKSLLSEARDATVEHAADLEKLQAEAFAHLPDVEAIKNKQLEMLEDLEEIKN